MGMLLLWGSCKVQNASFLHGNGNACVLKPGRGLCPHCPGDPPVMGLNVEGSHLAVHGDKVQCVQYSLLHAAGAGSSHGHA